MAYKIETISVYEAFEQHCACPLCALRDKLEADYTEYYLGNAAMLPEIRVEVNKNGFCGRHLDMLYEAGNRLPLALQMHTMLSEHNKRSAKAMRDYAAKCASRSGKAAQASLDRLEQTLRENEHSCLVCRSTRDNIERYIQTAVRLYFDESRFRELYENCSGFCNGHLVQLLRSTEKVCSRAENERFVNRTLLLQQQSREKLAGELEHFTKMFDYRSRGQEWGESRTAVARMAQLFGGDTRAERSGKSGGKEGK